MRRVGIALLLVGLVWAAVAAAQDATVPTGTGDRVYNLGLMDDRRNQIIIAGIVAVIGTVIAFTAPRTDSRDSALGSQGDSPGFVEDQVLLEEASLSVLPEPMRERQSGLAQSSIPTPPSNPDDAYRRWTNSGERRDFLAFVDLLGSKDDLSVGPGARDALLKSYPRAGGEPEFETLAGYLESLDPRA
ncbi:MAG TPA: hypothetical protein VGK50_07685 [Coriobacteriia bacterium]